MHRGALTLDSVKNRRTLQELWKSSSGFYVLIFLFSLTLIRWHDGFLYGIHHYVLGRDFINFWMAGKLAWLSNPGQYYDMQSYMQALEATVAKGYWTNQLSYPPSLFLIAAPFGQLPYWLCLIIWYGLNIFSLRWAIRTISPHVDLFWLAVLSPAALFCILCGQSSLLTASAIIAAFHQLDMRRWLADLLIGLV